MLFSNFWDMGINKKFESGVKYQSLLMMRKFYSLFIAVAQSAGTAEYTDCTSAEG